MNCHHFMAHGYNEVIWLAIIVIATSSMGEANNKQHPFLCD